MTLYTFQEVTAYVGKSGKCAICGKRGQRRHKLFQTINPYNKNAAGAPKSRDEIRAELAIDAAKLREAPFKHVKCEYAERVADLNRADAARRAHVAQGNQP